jgi:hypothetical protein
MWVWHELRALVVLAAKTCETRDVFAARTTKN